MKNILVTGGAGFIGSHIALHHLNKGDAVTVIDNLLSGNTKNIEPFKKFTHFKFIQADICTYQGLQELVYGSDSIYHMAAIVGQKLVLSQKTQTLSQNIKGCEVILEGMCHADKPIKLLIASTSSLYIHSQSKGQVLKEDDMLHFPSGEYLQETYRLSKLVNEVMALSYVKTKGLHCTLARFFNTIGLNQTGRYGMVVPNFVEQALKGIPITVFGDGLQTRSFCNAIDASMACDLLLENPKSKGEIVNIGNDRPISILDLAKLVKKLAKSSSEIRYVSYQEAYGIDFHDVHERKPCIDKLISLTGFRPQWTLEETIESIIQHYQKLPQQ